MSKLKWWMNVAPGSVLHLSAGEARGGLGEPFVVEARVAGDDGVHRALRDDQIRPGPAKITLNGDAYYDARVWVRFAGQGKLEGKAWIQKSDNTRHGDVCDFEVEGKENDTKRALTLAVLMQEGPAADGGGAGNV